MDAIDGILEQHAESSRTSNFGSRPSARSIYQQRKQYTQSLSKTETNFHHRVEHLLTCKLENDLRNVEDCLKHLSLMDSEGKVWGQELILQVDNAELVLTDLESRDSLESVPLQSIERCQSVMGRPPYNSILAVTAQNQRSASVLLFQCDEQPANIIHRNLEKALTQWKENQQSKDNIRSHLQSILVQRAESERRQSHQPSFAMEGPQLGRSGRETPQDSPISQRRFDPGPLTFHPPSHHPDMAEIERDIEVLNHVLRDIEIFVEKLNSDKKKKKGKASIPEAEFIDCLQKIKYSFNLLGKVQNQMYQPSAVELVHMLMSILPKILSKCPGKNSPSSVVSPFLTQRALLLLSSCVTEEERQLWESLGDAWLRTRADWPNGKMMPPYIPTFYDGWVPPEISPNYDQQEIPFPVRKVPNPSLHSSLPHEMPRETQTMPAKRHLQPDLVKVLYDFDARNYRELSVKKGDSVKVLDQSRQWWMVENARQLRGFVPNNILEITNNEQDPVRSVSLQPSSKPEEVTAWLQDKGFSRITVRCLGVLRGEQLLDLTREDLKAVCPEEGGRVFTQLSEVRAYLGM